MLEVKYGGRYEISELRMVGYSPLEVLEFKDPKLIEKYGTGAIRYRRGKENFLVVKDSGLLKVIACFKPGKGKGADIFREK